MKNNAGMLLRTLNAAEKNYFNRYSNLVGISSGTKFVKGKVTKEMCIQFFVEKKMVNIPQDKKFPSFVYGRKQNGKIDFSEKVKTDVIEVDRPQFSCGGGSKLKVPGESGTITLIFNNKIPGDDRLFLLTCAHVAGDVKKSPPRNVHLSSNCNDGLQLEAKTIKNSTHNRNIVEYDIAIAEIINDSSVNELIVIRDQKKLNKFININKIEPGLRVRCMSSVSKRRITTVHSYGGTLRAYLDNKRYTIRNLFILKTKVHPGDSGGIVYSKDEAVGFIVARSLRGWAWFQPLEAAIEYLSNIEPIFTLKVF